jgi:hypothetical protein
MSGKTTTSVNRRRHDQRPRLQQMDLFRAATVDSGVGAPAWQELPAEAQSMLTQLDSTADPRPCREDRGSAHQGGRR